MSNQTFLDEVNARIPDDTVVNVDAQGPVKFSIWISFAEIYNEYMYDLLEPLPKEKKIRRQALKLAEDKNGSIYIKGMLCNQMRIILSSLSDENPFRSNHTFF